MDGFLFCLFLESRGKRKYVHTKRTEQNSEKVLVYTYSEVAKFSFHVRGRQAIKLIIHDVVSKNK